MKYLIFDDFIIIVSTQENLVDGKYIVVVYVDKGNTCWDIDEDIISLDWINTESGCGDYKCKKIYKPNFWERRKGISLFDKIDSAIDELIDYVQRTEKEKEQREKDKRNFLSEYSYMGKYIDKLEGENWGKFHPFL